MGLVLIRDFKECWTGTYSGTKMYPVINDSTFNQIPSSIAWTNWMATTKWTIHLTTALSTYNGVGVIELTHSKYSTNNAVYMGTQGGNVAGSVTGIISTVGSGYFGLDVTTSNVTNVYYTIFVEGRVSLYS